MQSCGCAVAPSCAGAWHVDSTPLFQARLWIQETTVPLHETAAAQRDSAVRLFHNKWNTTWQALLMCTVDGRPKGWALLWPRLPASNCNIPNLKHTTPKPSQTKQLLQKQPAERTNVSLQLRADACSNLAQTVCSSSSCEGYYL